MLIITVVTAVCLGVLGLEALGVIASVIAKDRADRISFIRGFKKGKCAIIYITAIPLYCMGHLYNGEGFLEAFFRAVNKIINLVVLKYDLGTIEALMQDNVLYRFTIYFCFVMVGINALLLTLSLTSQHIWEFSQSIKAFVTSKDKVFLLGNNKENLKIYRSDRRRHKTIVDHISSKDCERLYLEKVSYISTVSFDRTIQKLFRAMFRRFPRSKRQYVVIVNTGNDDANMLICRSFVDRIRELDDAKKEVLFLQLKVFVFGDPRYETIYADIVSGGFGCIHYENKYQKIAMDFIDRYPFAKFMDEKQVDYETSLLRPDVEINVMMVGFGKTNQQILLTSVANNQFLAAGEGDPVIKPVNYWIFDRNEAENNKNLNHSYYRYRNECNALCESDYLPLPDLPAKEEYFRLDINDCNFYNTIRSLSTRGKNDANFVVIAFGTDLENIDMAQKLVEKRSEWGLQNLTIFVKVRVWHKEQTLLEEEGCYFIANESDVVYDLEKILGDKIFRMAQMRNAVYDLEYAITHNEGAVVDRGYVERSRAESNRNWYMSKTRMERESSLYCCLSLRSKLNLMGLDYCEIDATSEQGLSAEAYLELYAGSDRPDLETFDLKADGKPVVAYSLDFPASRRRNMAVHEHLRWNSFMISKGMVPATKKQILEERITVKGKEKFTNGKNYAIRRHGNLTTFEGLVEFRRMVAARDNSTEAEKDVIKYDYQLLDDAHWLLRKNGFKIVKHQKLQ